MFDPANANMKRSLRPYLPPNPVPAVSLQNYESYASTLLHELAHIAGKRGKSFYYYLAV